MASKTPVLAYGVGGVLETVKSGVTGEFFQAEKELMKLLKEFNESEYNGEKIREHARKFTEENFIHNFSKYVEEIYAKEKHKS